MSGRRRAITVLILLVAIVLAVLGILIPRAQADSAHARSNLGVPPPEASLALSDIALSDQPPPPAQDTCQHCHLSGSIDDMAAPLWRWVFFGLAGLVFAYGAVQAGSAWTKRVPWKPLWQRSADWLEDRYQIVEPLRKTLSKPVPRFATRWWYCLGGITFALLIIQGITGILLAFYYKPTPQEAYASIQFIENQVRFGSSIRAIHHWSANAIVVMVFAHLARVFITGAFKPPRELNWVSGVILLLVTLLFGLTGYLLPWDQRAYWATTVSTEIGGGVPQIGDLVLIFLRGGWEVTGITLSRFYALHILVLPAVILAFLGIHFWMVRRQGISRPL